MATSLQALLNIRANVQGEGAVAGLGKAIGGLKGAADGAGRGMSGLLGRLGGLGSAIGSLGPLVSAAGLGMLASNAINAGDAMWDMSQRTGVSVEMLSKFKQAAEMNGTSIEVVEKGMRALARSMKAAASVDLGGKTKEEVDEAVKALEEGGRRQVQAVEDGEKHQTAALDRQVDRKMAIMDRETDRRLSALARRYRREEQLLNDAWDDQRDAADKAAQDQVDQLLKNAQRRYEANKKAIENDKTLSDAAREQRLRALQDAYEMETDIIRDNAAKAQKIRDRAARDEQQKQQDAIDERRRMEEEAIKIQAEMEQQALKDRAEAKKAAIKKESDNTVAIIKASVAEAVKALKVDTGASSIEDEMREMGLSGKAASEAFRAMGIPIKDAAGQLRPLDQVMLDIADAMHSTDDGGRKAAMAMKIMKGAGADLIPMLNGGRRSIEELEIAMTTGFAKSAGEYDDKLKQIGAKLTVLGVQVAEALLPVLDKVSQAVLGILRWFEQLPNPLQNLIVWIGLFGIAWQAGLGALLTWMATTFLPAVLAIFSGPVGWTILAIAAVVAMAIAFREPIINFLSWWWETTKASLGLIIQGLYKLFLEPFVKIWTVMRDVATAFFRWLPTGWEAFSKWVVGLFTSLGKAFTTFFVDPVRKAFTFVVDAGKNALRGLLQWAANAINGVIDLINRMINAVNSVRGPLGMSTFDTIKRVTIPAFAQGGFVTAPTVGLVGEAGREYIIPESKAAGFAANFMAGARGSAAIPTTGGGTSGSVSVNLTTGPVVQLPDGGRAVMLEDVERLITDTVRQLRTPAGRYAMGVR